MQLRPLRRVRQKLGFCGPASIEMMYSTYGRVHTQDQIADIAHIIEGEAGSRLDELDFAVRTLSPDLVLLAKYDSAIADLSEVINCFHLPVGIEWQGMFYNDQGVCFEIGHYSLVVDIDLEAGLLWIVDPDERSALPENGELAISALVERWWDENDVPLPGSKNGNDQPETEVIYNEHLLFVLVPPAQIQALSALGFQPVTQDLLRRHRVPDPKLLLKKGTPS